jgi:nicotinate-nucleotide adenylyltransferase
VTFLPAGDPWRKSRDPDRSVTPVHHRLAMLRLALRGNRKFVIDDRELHRAGPTYTIDTLRELHAEGRAPVTMILGTDAIASLPEWREAEAILDLCTIAIARKPADLPGTEGGPDAIDTFRHRYPHASVVIIESLPPTYISSTLIRERIRSGQPVRYLAPDPVLRYIGQQGLYEQQ